ncbi:MAG: hypothetical protein RLY58_1344 [Pseudomonadota bacterium]|jgi:twitching motility protein PilI
MAARGFIELLRLAERGRQRLRGGQDGGDGRWSGVAFLLNDHYFVAPLGEISEVLNVPDTTSVPSTQAWLRGLANVRGRLLPISDLAMFVGAEKARTDTRRKVMVIDQPTLFGGVIVDEVLGIQHFIKNTYFGTTSVTHVGIAPYVQGYFERDGQRWHIFMPSRLAADPRFLNAAIL